MRERPRSGGVVGDKQNLIVRPPFESEQKKELLKVRKLADKARSSTVAPQTFTEELTEWTRTAPTEATEASPKPPHPLPVGQMFRQEVNNKTYILHNINATSWNYQRNTFLHRCTALTCGRMWPCLDF